MLSCPFRVRLTGFSQTMLRLWDLKFLSIVEILPFDTGAAEEYGNICAFLRKKGTPIGTMDMLISAHAKSEGLTVVTHNTREFERVSELKLEDWFE